MAKPDDVSAQWLNVIRSAQAACKDNNGYGVVYLKVVVIKNVPAMWVEPKLDKIHPLSLNKISFTPALAAALSSTIRKDEEES